MEETTMKTMVGLAAVAILAGCSTTTSDAEPALQSTSWSMVSFTSMDDAQEPVTPKQGQKITIEFDQSGKAIMQLDCNRGNADYEIEAASDTNGSIKFGPAAVTRALCPDPRASDLLAARLGDIVSYTLDNGSLFLALKLDSGIFEFERVN